MPVSGDLVFVHVPKCGGTSITTMMGLDASVTDHDHLTGWCGELPLQHLTAREMRERIGGSGRWFSVVRSPHDRLMSEFSYRTRQGVFPYAEGLPTLDEFVDGVVTGLYQHRHLTPQVEFVRGVCELYLLEEMPLLAMRIFGRAPPHLNASEHLGTYAERSWQLIANHYAADMELVCSLRAGCR